MEAFPSARHQRCSFMTPPLSPPPLYKTGSSYPAKGTMSPPSSLCKSKRVVFTSDSFAADAEKARSCGGGAVLIPLARRRRDLAAVFIVLKRCWVGCSFILWWNNKVRWKMIEDRIISDLALFKRELHQCLRHLDVLLTFVRVAKSKSCVTRSIYRYLSICGKIRSSVRSSWHRQTPESTDTATDNRQKRLRGKRLITLNLELVTLHSWRMWCRGRNHDWGR